MGPPSAICQRKLNVEGEAIALLTTGGNGLLSKPDRSQRAEMQRFAEALERFLHSLRSVRSSWATSTTQRLAMIPTTSGM